MWYVKVTVYAFHGKGGRRREAHVSNMHRHLKCTLVWRVLTYKVPKRRRVLTVFIQTVGDQGHLPHAVVRL